ncbi:uncharacterized protein BJ171DRAFT_495029 [Polychytrium aggregatum]|uniref:uncharacterized protein n=1 Tax=Polychytrium aggregatum TaxID=110093 RepID=UPI0022FE9F73|nr:uncharacterized protein BJ171DRAFT_495029 [Polychytrium aggregatum]KAI9206870.1 hypothetical protein BJ171DRAFT_495029 [Polychytrium aggregatum]
MGGKDDPKTPSARAPMGDSDEHPPDFNPVATFQALAAQGDLLAQKASYNEAIECYTEALALQPTHKHCLVARSRCFIQIGQPLQALQDADASLKDDPTFHKGVYQKAESLYAQGDFELALMYYHRGNRSRPELDEFRIGIQKAREAIENSIGAHKDHQIPFKSNLPALAAQAPTSGPATVGGKAPTPSKKPGSVPTKSPKSPNTKPGPGKSRTPSSKSSRINHEIEEAMARQLLGELYDDKVYLEELLSDPDMVENRDEDVVSYVTEGLSFLEGRIAFWKQQKPIYAQPKEKKRMKPRMQRPELTSHRTKAIVLEPVDPRCPLPPVRSIKSVVAT